MSGPEEKKIFTGSLWETEAAVRGDLMRKNNPQDFVFRDKMTEKFLEVTRRASGLTLLPDVLLKRVMDYDLTDKDLSEEEKACLVSAYGLNWRSKLDD